MFSGGEIATVQMEFQEFKENMGGGRKKDGFEYVRTGTGTNSTVFFVDVQLMVARDYKFEMIRLATLLLGTTQCNL